MIAEHLRQDLHAATVTYSETQAANDRARGFLVGLMIAAKQAGATNQEIGDVLGVSRQRVSQLLRRRSDR